MFYEDGHAFSTFVKPQGYLLSSTSTTLFSTLLMEIGVAANSKSRQHNPGVQPTVMQAIQQQKRLSVCMIFSLILRELFVWSTLVPVEPLTVSSVDFLFNDSDISKSEPIKTHQQSIVFMYFHTWQYN